MVTGTLGGLQTADRVAVGARGLNAFRLADFTIKTGAGDDNVAVLSDTITPPAVGTYVPTGAFVNGVPQYREVTGGFSVDGGSGINSFAASADSDWTLALATLTAGNRGQVQLANVRDVSVTGWSAGGAVVLDGGQGSDEFRIATAALDAVTLADAGGSLDQLTLAGTAADDTFVINPAQINFSSSNMGYGGMEVLSL